VLAAWVVLSASLWSAPRPRLAMWLPMMTLWQFSEHVCPCKDCARCLLSSAVPRHVD
jgi:hypothetical protein